MTRRPGAADVDIVVGVGGVGSAGGVGVCKGKSVSMLGVK